MIPQATASATLADQDARLNLMRREAEQDLQFQEALAAQLEQTAADLTNQLAQMQSTIAAAKRRCNDARTKLEALNVLEQQARALRSAEDEVRQQRQNLEAALAALSSTTS